MEQTTGVKIIILSALLIAAFVAFKLYTSNRDFSNFVDEYLLGTANTEEVQKKPSPKEIAIFFIADNTGSVLNYSIPKLDTSIISKSIDQIHKHGGGHIYISSFDANAKNQQNLHFKVPANLENNKEPKRNSGETYYEYDRKMKAFQVESAKWKSDSLAAIHSFIKDKAAFMTKVSEYLTLVYSGIKSENNSTNVRDLLSAAFNCIGDLQAEKVTKKFIVGYSDFEETVSLSKTEFVIPGDIKVIAVNPVPGTLKTKVNNKIVEVHPDRLLDKIFE